MELKLLKLLGSEDYVPSNVPELLSQLGMKPNQQQVLQSLLKSLEKQGKIVRTKGNRYIVAKEADLIPGVIQITRGGRGFVQPDEAGITEISIDGSGTDTAMHGDRVLVRDLDGPETGADGQQRQRGARAGAQAHAVRRHACSARSSSCTSRRMIHACRGPSMCAAAP
jgi:exoribonuclease R